MEGEEGDSFASSIFNLTADQKMSDHETTSKTPNGAAPTAAIELIVIGRPLKVMSFLLIALATLFFFLGCASSNWLNTSVVRVGLWEECYMNISIVPEGKTPCNNEPCSKSYSLACGALTVMSIICSFTALVCLGCGMQTKSIFWKFNLYNITIGFLGVACILYLVPLVGYPMMFMQEITRHQIDEKGFWWTVGWAYGMGWVGIILSFISCLVIRADKTTDEVVYREIINKSESIEEDA